MKSSRILFVCFVYVISFLSCNKKAEPIPTPVPTTGAIKIIFTGTPAAGYGDTVKFSFAKDLYNFNVEIYSFTKLSRKPHSEIIINDVEPREWYYLQEISTPGLPDMTDYTIKVVAGKTALIEVQF